MREIADKLSPMKVDTAQDQGSLYEITQLASPQDEAVLCCAGLYDESSLLLLYSNPDSQSAVSSYSAQLLNLLSGEKEELASFDRAQAPERGSDGTEGLSVLSCDPLIVFDSRCGILYRPGTEAGSVVLPSYLQGAQPYWLGGRLWLSCDRGILYEVTKEGNLRVSWVLPCEFGAFTPVVSGHEGRLSFSTYSRRDPSLQVYVDVDPEPGESEYYLSDINPSRFTVTDGRRLLGSSFRTKPVISVCDLSEHIKREMELPEEVLSLIGGSSADKADSFLAYATFPRSLLGDWCCWALCDDAGRPVHLYLWNTASCHAVKWEIPSRSDYEAPETADYGSLTDRAAALEDRYGIRILIGTNIPAEFPDYTAEPCTDAAVIDGSLSVLENVLSLYPDTYFTQLKGSYYRNIVLCLTGALHPLDAASNISNAGAFATESNGTMQLAFDLYDDLSPDTVVHELTHAADYRFAGEGLLSEDEWNSMNPKGFSYYYSYINESGESYETAGNPENTAVSGCPADDVWFIDPYSKTYPMEDRARLMETLLSGRTPYSGCFKGRHVQEKLSYYFRFLRETLDDGSWPARTSWEEALAGS
ncbi:MAG: hypothetical protein K6G34_08170 [Lachnospiraceae bacterium]|nr:hypothetical protein [Lachnospiraceae bacterium]